MPPGRLAELLQRRAVAWACLALLCTGLGAAALRPIWDGDLGWHLAMGRDVALHARVPDTEPFTHTARGNPMVAHEWLTQLMYHAVTDVAGIRGLRMLHALVTALAPVLFFWVLRSAGISAALCVAGVLVWAVIAESRFALRPQMLSLLLSMASFQLLFVRRPSLTDRQLAGCYALTVLWANLHSAAVLLPVLVGVYAIVEVVAQRTGWRSPRADDLGGGRPARLFALAGLTTLAVFVTPNHFHLIPYVLESGRLNTQLSAEWFGILYYVTHPSGDPAMLVLLALVTAATLVAALWRGRDAPLSLTVVVLCVAALPLASQRFVDLQFVPILYGLDALSRWLRAQPPGSRLPAAIPLVGLVAAAGVAWQALSPKVQPGRIPGWLEPAANFEPVAFPVDAVRFLDAVRLEGRLFNIERWGGYLALHLGDAYPHFIDGRWVTIGERVTRDSLRIERRGPGSFELLRAYGVDLLLVPRGWMTDALLAEQGFIPVFENYNSGVYLRDAPETRPDLQRCAAYYAERGIPFDRQQGFDGRAARAANPSWADRFHVSRRHLDHFRVWGTPTGIAPARLIDAW